jgi:hypothetical protein
LVHAQMLQPGLWELTTSNMQVDGKPLPDMQFMLGQLKNLPPEQRAMMEGALAKQGISVGGKGVRSCLTPEQVKTNDIPLQDLNRAAPRRSPTAPAMSGSSSSAARKPRAVARPPSSVTGVH